MEHADDSGYVRLDEILPALAAGVALRAGAGALMRAGGNFLARRAAARAASAAAKRGAARRGGAAAGGGIGAKIGSALSAAGNLLGGGVSVAPDSERYSGGSASYGQTQSSGRLKYNPMFSQANRPGSYLASRLQR